MSIKNLLTINYIIISLGILVLGGLGFFIHELDHTVIKKQEIRYQSYLLADQLRQSSDDLTKMARTYVMTGDEQYEKIYWDILAIRNGEKPRLDGEIVSLQQLMRNLGFTEKEFAKLQEAQNNSNNLITTETIAMNAMKGLYDDGNGNYVKPGEPNIEMAQRIMYDMDYHQSKVAIMKPIDEFFQLFDQRTKSKVDYHIEQANSLLIIMQILATIFIIITIGLGIFVTTRILKQVGGDPVQIAQITSEVAIGKLKAISTNLVDNKTPTGIYASIRTMVISFKVIIEDIVQVSQGLAKGNLRITPQAEYNGDFQTIKLSLDTGLSNLRSVIEDIVQVSEGLAAGNLQIKPQAEYNGDFMRIKNALETALSNLKQVTEDIVEMSQALAEGKQDVTTKAEYRGDFLKVKDALQLAATKLSEATKQNAVQDWVKTGQTQLNQQVSGEQNLITLAEKVITFITTYLDAQVGVFYLLEHGESGAKNVTNLKLAASYAYTQRKGMSNNFKIGEGLVGQAAMEKQKILVTDIPDDYIYIQSGLGESVPKNIVVYPFMYDSAVKGVVEIGAFNELSPIQLEWLDQVMPSIGIAVNTAESRMQMQALLGKSNLQADVK
ncbi:MAG: GAF domain-containing protein [Thiomargarita sp.]|nr:GAF domain-containing protein [Thiomargarita sp.]